MEPDGIFIRTSGNVQQQQKKVNTNDTVLKHVPCVRCSCVWWVTQFQTWGDEVTKARTASEISRTACSLLQSLGLNQHTFILKVLLAFRTADCCPALCAVLGPLWVSHLVKTRTSVSGNPVGYPFIHEWHQRRAQQLSVRVRRNPAQNGSSP